jgi:hypothetical protein
MGMLLNHAWFRNNGGPLGGFVLKPTFMTSTEYNWDPNADYMNEAAARLTVRIISAQQLPKKSINQSNRDRGEIVDPYVEVNVHGIEKDKR